MFDVLVIGAGVTGCCIIRNLAQYNLKLAIVDKYTEPAGESTKANSGIIHAGHHSPPETLKGQLVTKGNSAFDKLQNELHFGFKRCGELLIAQSTEELPELRKIENIAKLKNIEYEIWDQKTIRNKEPNLAHHIVEGIFTPSAGVINPYEFTMATLENAISNGVNFINNSIVTEIIKHTKHFEIIIRNTATKKLLTIQTKFIVNAAGVHADKIAALAGADNFTIHPRIGEEYLLDKKYAQTVKSLIFPIPTPISKGILLIPTVDGPLMIGPTAVNTDDRENTPTTPEGAEKIFSYAQKICPSIDPRDTIAHFAGLRAVSHNNDFIIEPSPVKAFINAAGIQSPGLTAAPAIADLIAEILKNEGLQLSPAKNFNPERKPIRRFENMTFEEKQQAILKNPDYAKIVCACELVTKADVHDAINAGATTLDGIKFRTRAGMGPCQSGFCTPMLMEILAEKLQIPIEQVTKKSPASNLLFTKNDDD